MITVFSRQNLPCFQITYNVIQGSPPVNCGESIQYIDCSGNPQSIAPPGGVWPTGASGTFCASQTPVAPCPSAREFNMVISNIGVCGTSPTPTPSVTPTRTPSPSPTPTPTPTCAPPGQFLEGTECYGNEWNVFLRASSLAACRAAQGLDGSGANAPNLYKSCCDYQSRFVNGNPSGCQVYDANGNVVGDGWISDGCLSWQIINGIVISTAGQACSGSDPICCGTSPT